MRKRLFLLFAILATVAGAMAKPVEPPTASQVASHWLKAVTGKTYDNLTDITANTPFHEFYVFTLNSEGGFILIAADDCVLPVLGYSETSTFPVKDMPAHVMEWMQKYDEQIAFYRDLYGEQPYGGSDEVRTQWTNLIIGTTTEPPLPTSVSPLITTTWNQSPYYNNLCPSGTYTGCAATAAAQIMKYWNHPSTGYGSHSYVHSSGTLSANFGSTTYNWNNMPSSLTSSSTSAQVNAVATLMYHIGVAIEMNYGSDGSSAATASFGSAAKASCENAFPLYFKYKPTVHSIYRAEYSDAEWSALLVAELDAQRPILYTGFDVDAGHAFVFDGYNNQGQFHVNWGWNGYCDGYYTIGALNPSTGGQGGNTSGTYNLRNYALIGIEPNTNWSSSATTTVNATASNTSYGSVTGAGTYNFGDTITLSVSTTTGNRFYGWSDGNTITPRAMIATGGTLNLTANVGPLTGDTLSYCFNTYSAAYGFGSTGNDLYWGIVLPASKLPVGHPLTTVQVYIPEAGNYDLTVYTGTSPSTTVYSQSYSFTSTGWVDLSLTTPVAVDGTQNFWIFFHNNDAVSPMAVSKGSGNQYESLYKTSEPSLGGSLYSLGVGAFMIRAIFSDPGGTPPDPGPDPTPSGCNIVLTIGDTTSTTTTIQYPVNNFYKYTLSETIIDAAELQGLGQITSISYRYNHTEASTNKTDVTIWIQPTTKTAFTSNSDLELLDANTAVMVYSGALNCSQGWNEFQFTTPFNYDGTSNLMIIVDDNSNAYNSNSYTFNTAACSGYKTLVWFSDSNNPDPTNSSYSGTKQYYQARVQMRLKGCEPLPDNVTVADGTDNNIYVPVYGYYADAFLRSQTIYPATILGSSNLTTPLTAGSTITAITYYLSTPASSAMDGTFEVKLSEVSNTTLSGFLNVNNATTVYTGTLDATNNEMTITFTTPYTYNGGNLLVEVTETAESSDYPSTTFMGVNTTGASWQGHSYTSVDAITGTGRDFMPKTTFAYTRNNSGSSFCAAPLITIDSVDGRTVWFSWSSSADSVYIKILNTEGQQVIGQFLPATGSSTGVFLPEQDFPLGYVYIYGAAYCGGTDTSEWAYDVLSVTCDQEAQCPVTIVLNDGYGDGWNGGALDIYDSISGLLFTSLTCPDHGNSSVASTDTMLVNLCTGRTYSVVYRSGQFDDEVSFQILNSNGDTLINVSDPAAGVQGYFAHTCGSQPGGCTVALPYTETFEENSVTLDCWTTDGPGTWQFGSYTSTGATYEGSNYAYIRHATSGNVTKLISPVINASSNATVLQLTFAHIQKVWSGDQDQLRVYYRTSASDSWVMAAEYTNDIQTWTVENVMIPTNTYQVAFEMTDGYGYGVAVDSVVFTEITASYCYPPAGLTASDITADGATLTWTGDAASYNVYAIADGATTLLQNVTATTITLTGLTAMTQYTYGVRSVCGTNESEMVTVSFTTACTAVTLPFTETFEATSGTTGCWTTDGPGTWQFGYYTSTGATYEGSNYAYIRHATNGNVTKLISPVINASSNATVLQLTFAHIQKVWSGDQDQLRVYYRTSASDSWVMAAEYTNDIQTWTVENVMIPTNTYQVAFEMTDGYGYGVAVDSVVVTEMTTSYCYPVSAVTVNNVTATGATISWTDDNNSGATYSIIGADGSVVATGLTATTYTFSGLTASTAYTFAVVTNCSADNASDSTLVTFTTDCAGGSCTVKIYATDGYGDGWNNSVLTLSQNGATVATYNMASQGQYNTPIYDTFQVSVCSGIPVSFSWTSGSTYDYEAGFQILDGNDTVLYTVTDASTLTDGAVFYTVADACGNNIPTPPALDSMKVTVAVNDVTMGTTVPAPGVHYFYEGDTCSVVAVPNTGYHLQGWTIFVTQDGTTVNIDTTIATTATDVFDIFDGVVVAHGDGIYEWTVTANFAADPTIPDTLAVTFAVNNAAMGTITPAPGTYYYPEGDTVFFSATANSGYQFVGWVMAAGAAVDTLGANYISTYFTANSLMAYGSVTLTALFEVEPAVPDTLFVTFAVDDATMGTTIPAPGTYQYFDGDSVHYGSQANPGYHFLMWEVTIGNDVDTFDATYANGHFLPATILMGESPVIFKAFFEPDAPNSATITYAVNDASMGTTTPAPGTYTIYVGDSIGATAIPAAGHSLSNWTLDVVVSGAVVNSYTLTDNPVFFGYVTQTYADNNATLVLTANFVTDSIVPEPDSLILITAVNNPTMGTILPASGTHILHAGDTFSVRAVPNAGYHVESWHIVYSHGPYTIYDTVINLGLEEFFSLDTADYYLGMTMSFTANFAAGEPPVMNDSVTVITSVNDPTMGTITPAPGTHYYMGGDTVEFNIQPNPGYYVYALQVIANHPLMGLIENETLMDSAEIAEMIAEMTAEPLVVDAEMYGLTIEVNVIFAAIGETPEEYTVSVNYNSTMGNVTVNGESVANGTVVTAVAGQSISLTANANNNYEFVAWVDNGDTIEGSQTVYTINNIDANHSVTAVFKAVTQGIEDIDMDNVTIYSINDMIVVRGAEGKQVVLFDVNGRMLSREASAAERVEFRVVNNGVYLVKVANAAAKRVVVIR